MSLAIGGFNKGGSGHSNPQVGAQVGRLVQVVDKGIQARNAYQGVAKDPCQQLILTFELPNDRIEIEGVSKPRWFSQTVNALLGPKANLSKMLAILDPQKQAGTVGELVNTPCIINIVQKTDANDNPIDGVKIDGISALPAGLEVPALENPARVFDFAAPDAEVFKLLPTWLQDDVKKAQNYPGSTVEQMVASLGTVATVESAQPAAQPAQAVVVVAQTPQAVATSPVVAQAQPEEVAVSPQPVTPVPVAQATVPGAAPAVQGATPPVAKY